MNLIALTCAQNPLRADNFNMQLNTDLSGAGLIVNQFLISIKLKIRNSIWTSKDINNKNIYLIYQR